MESPRVSSSFPHNNWTWVAGRSCMWLAVAGSGRQWPAVAGSGWHWPAVAGSGRRKGLQY
jgi:hypothetical protein